MKLALAGAAALFMLTGPAMAASCPNTGLKQKAVTFETAKGRFSYTLEVADGPEEQECGLMYRKAMAADHGMIFPFKPPRPASFWMENTVLPLDLVFVAPGNTVLSIGHGKPFSRAIIDSGGNTAAVIELNAGEAARIGLKPGDRVER